MDRAYEANPGSNAPAAPNPPLLGYPNEGGSPTIPGAWWFYMLTEEVRAVIVAAGIAPDATTVNQLATAVQDIAQNIVNAAIAGLTVNWAQITGVKNADELQGYTASAAATANTIALRDAAAGLTAASFNVSSDRRLKKNVRRMRAALERIELLTGVTFQWKASGDSAAGLIAQDVARAVPEGVRSDKTLFVDPMAVIGLLVEGLKEERAARIALEKRLAKLERAAQ